MDCRTLPAAIERAYGIAKSVDLPGARRWIPPFLSLTSAIENSRKDQTLNTPAVATLIMLENQVRWLNDNGGLAWLRPAAQGLRPCCTSGRRSPITPPRS